MQKNKAPKWGLIVIRDEKDQSLFYLDSKEKLVNKFKRCKPRNLQNKKKENNQLGKHQDQIHEKTAPALLHTKQNSQNNAHDVKKHENILINKNDATKQQALKINEDSIEKLASLDDLIDDLNNNNLFDDDYFNEETDFDLNFQ